MTHQARCLELADEPRLLVEAPTGAGKTWSGAAPLLDRADVGEGGIFAYPTNALADDQQRSLAELVQRAGRRPALVLEDGSLDTADADLMLWRVHAGTIEEASTQVGGRTRGAVLSRMLERLPAKPLWLITNPDTLYLLCTARYALSPQIWSRLASCRSLVMDEFHLYRGPTLVRALALVELLCSLVGVGRVRVLSATLPPAVRTLLTERLGFTAVSAEVARDGRIVQHPITLSPVMATGEAATERITDAIMSIVTRLRAEIAPGRVPLLVLRQSVLATTLLEDRLAARGIDRAEIGVYRGLTSKAIRSIDSKTLVLGTSALEVGVDFQTSRLLFEALSASSFTQRLGRVGRHGPGEARYFTDARVATGLSELDDCDRDTLFRLVSKLLPADDDLAAFVLSSYGRCVADATFAALNNRGKALGAPDEFFHAVAAARQNLVHRAGMAAPPPAERISRAARRRLTDAVGFRGGPGSVEVFDVRERERRGSDDLAVYEVDLPFFYRRARWQVTSYTGKRPVILGFGSPRRLSLSLATATAGQLGIHAPAAADLQLRVDGAATRWESLLYEREHVVGLFPRSLRRRLTWREDVFESDHGHLALLDDDALVAAFLLDA